MNVSNFPEFQKWLKDQPQEVCRAIVYRAVMRILPFTVAPSVRKPPDRQALLNLRAVLVSGVAAWKPDSDIRHAARRSYDALYHNRRENDIYGAATAVRAAVDLASGDGLFSASDAVINAVRMAAMNDPLDETDDSELVVWQDTNISSTKLLSSSIDTGAGFSRAVEGFRRKDGNYLELGGPWTFWADWYAHAIAGDPLPWELQKQVALIPDEIWAEGPEAISAEIEKLEFQFRSKIAPSLVRDDYANVFRIEDDPDVPRDVAEFATHRAGQALRATLASVSDNVFNEGSYEAVVVRETLDGPKTMKLLAAGLYDACLGLDENIGDRYPEEVALINLKNALAVIVDELCELDDAVRQWCARRAGYAVPSVEKALTKEELESIPQLTAGELEPLAREVIESDIERILANEAAMPRWRRIRLANWMTTISIYWDRTKKGFKEAETLAKMVSKLRSAWRNLDDHGG